MKTSSKTALRLKQPGWSSPARAALKDLILAGANQNLPAVFDFDNTIVCGDIGEATLAVLARSKVLTPESVEPSFCPPFRTRDKRMVRLCDCEDVTQYYEALLEPTMHGTRDSQPMANGYAWATQVMGGLKLQQVVDATRKAFEWKSPEKPGRIEVTPGRTSYPVPFFYPETVELIALLLKCRFDVWIVSASNVWSVRWLVLHGLNPLLRQAGVRTGLAADHVVGISTLLADRDSRLYKDQVLVREDTGYAALHPDAVKRFRLTGQLQYPVPTYSGKVAAIWDLIGAAPYFAAGDSPGDLPMLRAARHRLWIARMKKPGYQKEVQACMQSQGEGWVLQEDSRWAVPRGRKRGQDALR